MGNNNQFLEERRLNGMKMTYSVFLGLNGMNIFITKLRRLPLKEKRKM